MIFKFLPCIYLDRSDDHVMDFFGVEQIQQIESIDGLSLMALFVSFQRLT